MTPEQAAKTIASTVNDLVREHWQKATDLPIEDDPIKLTFTVEINPNGSAGKCKIGYGLRVKDEAEISDPDQMEMEVE